MSNSTFRGLRLALAFPLAVGLVQVGASAQDRLKAMPGYEQFQKMRPEIQQAVRTGAATAVSWQSPTVFEYTVRGDRFRYDIAARTSTPVAAAEPANGRGRGGRGGGQAIERGRQAVSAESPDGKLRAFYRDRNLWMSAPDGSGERQLTTDGSEKDRIKYGTASWVYGEELNQTTAMWWSPDSTKLAYYRFEEKDVQDYYLQLDQTKIQSTVDIEAYPKAGTPNPVVDLFVYDVASGKTARVDVRSGQPFDNAVVGHYVYRIAWSPDGTELLFNRTNRRQQILEFVAANPATGATRVILREEWPTGWVTNSPAIHWLSDGRRFIWQSERTGWANLYLYDISGKLIAPLTAHTTFETAGLTKVDEQAGVVFYQARSGDNHMKVQLHRVGLDGKGDVRLTDPAFHHTVGGCLGAGGGGGRGGAAGGANACGISPDNKYFVDVYQTHKMPPATRLVDAAAGTTVAELAASDMARYKTLGFRPAEMFTYKAADGQTTLYGMIQFPSNFDPSRKYPALASVYGGPGSIATRETYASPNALAEYGFLILSLDSRSSPGRGKRTLDASYLKLGVTEMADMAEGVKALWNRPYFDRNRVGIYGTSYGGYAAVLSLLRYPDVYQAASASSPVSSWYHYDTIYTERYMWIPQENKEGYEAGNAMNYAKDLRGRLMLYYGTADNNVHPSNMMQLIKALQDAGKSFEVQIGPDRGHTSINQDRMMEFFIENLVVRPAAGGVQTY
jgi:dipeptidyl-peptidase-4